MAVDGDDEGASNRRLGARDAVTDGVEVGEDGGLAGLERLPDDVIAALVDQRLAADEFDRPVGAGDRFEGSLAVRREVDPAQLEAEHRPRGVGGYFGYLLPVRRLDERVGGR